MLLRIIMDKYLNCGKFVLYFLILAVLLIAGCLPSNKNIVPVKEISGNKLTPKAKSTFYYLKYQTLVNEGKNKKALQALQNAIKFDPDPKLFMDQIYYHLQNNNIDHAEKAIKKALNKYPEHKHLNLAKVRLLLSRDKYDEAMLNLENLIQEDKPDPEFKRLMAKLYLKRNKFAKALDLLKSIPDKKHTAETHYLMANAYSSLDNQKNAIHHLKTATQKDPSFIQAWVELAYQHEMKKDYVAAKEAYKQILKRGEENPKILIRLVDINLKLNNPEKAMQIVKQGPENQEFLLEACGLFLQNDFFQQSKTLLNKIQKEKKSSKALLYRAIIAHQENNDISKALEYLDLIDKNSKLYKRSLILKCRLLYAQNEKEKASELAKKGQELFPEVEEFWLLKSEYYAQEEQYDKALQILKKGLEFNDNNTNLLFQLGVMESQLNNTEKSINYMEKVINIDSEHAKALNFLGYTLTEETKNLDRAKILIEKALELDPENGYYLDSLAWMYYKSDNYEKAWNIINKALEKVDSDPIIWEHYGDIASELGKKEQSIKGYKKALDLESENSQEVRKKIDKLQ